MKILLSGFPADAIINIECWDIGIIGGRTDNLGSCLVDIDDKSWNEIKHNYLKQGLKAQITCKKTVSVSIQPPDKIVPTISIE